MLGTLTFLLVCQAAGEILVRLAGLPVPGPVAGMVLLFVWLMRRDDVPDATARTAGGLLEHLSLLFVPAGVGVVLYIDLIAEEWRAIAGALFVSTFAAMLVTAFTMRWLLRRAPNSCKLVAFGSAISVWVNPIFPLPNKSVKLRAKLCWQAKRATHRRLALLNFGLL
jgi:holin-like protein